AFNPRCIDGSATLTMLTSSRVMNPATRHSISTGQRLTSPVAESACDFATANPRRDVPGASDAGLQLENSARFPPAFKRLFRELCMVHPQSATVADDPRLKKRATGNPGCSGCGSPHGEWRTDEP